MQKPTLQVIVIDPFKKEIRYDIVQNPKITKNYLSFNDEIYELMSGGPIEVDIMEAAYLQTEDAQNRDCIMVDEHGLFNDIAEQQFFVVDGAYPQPLAGIGVVLGTDKAGDSSETCLTLEWFKERIKFYNFQQLKQIYG